MNDLSRNCTIEELAILWESIAKRQIMKDGAREKIKNLNLSSAKNYIKDDVIIEDGIKRASEIKVEKEDTILEIGAGPGIISFELAKRAKSLTAIEPAKAFVTMFMERAKTLGVSNVSVITEFWEDYKGSEHYDVVVSSFSLITRDIVNFLEKMNYVAKKKCYIHWFYRNCAIEMQNKDVSKIVGREYFELIPKLDIVYNILSQWNFKPTLKMLPFSHFDRVYDSIEKALESLKNIFCIENNTYDEKLRSYIREKYICKNGKYIYPDSTEFASLSWEK